MFGAGVANTLLLPSIKQALYVYIYIYIYIYVYTHDLRVKGLGSF